MSFIKKLVELWKQDIPISTALSLIWQERFSSNALIHFKLGDTNYYFRRDPVTVVYGYSAVKKIRSISEQLKKEQILNLLDIGGNNGWFSACIARTHPGVRSYIIEPNQKLKDAIYRNCSSLDIDFSLHFIGISNFCGTASFNIATDNSQQSSLYRQAITIFSEHQPIEIQQIEVETLDNFCEHRSIDSIDLLKVDIQGAEHLLLEGAARTLKKTRMALFEISFIEEHAIDVFTTLLKEFDSFRVLSPVSFGADILFYREADQND